MKELSLGIEVLRGTTVESRHRVHAAVVDARGCLVAGSGDARFFTHLRSCAKPFQVMPLVESGGFDELRWGDNELALACGSHGGEPEHVAIAESMLATMGFEEGDLVCGSQEPLAPRGAKLLRESGERPTRLHNNCSGKHAAMLGRAMTAGWAVEGYEREHHPVQQDALRSVAHWSRHPASEIRRAVDGCGVVEFALPLEALARAYAAFGHAAGDEDSVAARVLHAMRTRPFLIGGTDRFDTIVGEETEGDIVVKLGAEGVHAAVVPAMGLGFAIKVEDGAARAQYPAMLRLLQHFDALPATLSGRLAEYLRRPLRNTRGEVVGEVRPLA
ncbi:MAG TPA: asparaginase [Gemmatimonadaceae bacterium]|nr:asparaginase [Gemmatimonadaceae bacterium]